jgi:hypothetical protein
MAGSDMATLWAARHSLGTHTAWPILPTILRIVWLSHMAASLYGQFSYQRVASSMSQAK